MKKKHLLRRGFVSSIYNYIGKIVENIFIFLTSIYIIKFLSVEEYGIYNILAATLMIALNLHFGIPQIINRFAPELIETQKWRAYRKLIRWSLLLRLLTGLIIAGTLVIFIEKFMTTFKIPSNFLVYIYLFCFLIIIKLQSSLLEYFMDTLLDYGFKSAFFTVYSVIRFLLFYYVLSKKFQLVGVVWAWIISESLLFIFLAVRNINLLAPLFSKAQKDSGQNQLAFRRVARYGSLYFLSGMGGYVLSNSTDKYFISAFSDNIQVGLYSFGARLVTLASRINPIMFVESIITTLLVRDYSSEENKSNLLYAFHLYNKLTFFFGLPIYLGLCLYGDKIVLFLFDKPEYLEAVPIIWGWAFIDFFSMLAIVVIPFISILERTEIMTFSLVFAVLNIVLFIILIPKIGIYGAVLATGLSQISAFYFRLALLKRYLVVTYPWKCIVKIGINIVIFGTAAYFFRSLVKNIISLILVSSSMGVFYFFLSYVHKVFDPKDRDVLNKAIGKKLFVF